MARHQAGGQSAGSFQSQFAAQTAQVAALLDGTDSNPVQTLGTLGGAAISTNVGQVTEAPDFCFGPKVYYSNHPDAGLSVNPPIDLNGQIPGGDLGIWSPTDSSGTQACAAAELNYLLSTDAGRTQFALALAAEVEFLAGTNFPTTSGQSYDATAALTGLLTGTQVTVTAATVGYDGTSYQYSLQFSVANSNANQPGSVKCSIGLKHTPGASATDYSGVAQYSFDDGSVMVAGTTRYQRTSQTHLDISARDTFYASGSTPQLDSNGELDPNDPNFSMRFSRIGASFDPTSAMTPGSFVFVLNLNAPNAKGAGLGGLLDTFQLVLPGDGTGSAYYGFGASAINSPSVWQATGALTAGVAVGTIDEIYCMRQSGVSHSLAQFQALEYNSSDGQYEPSTTVASQIRFAPTSTCQYTDAQWNGGVSSGFWYDRHLQDSNGNPQDPNYQPTPPNPIPQYVVADPADSQHPFSLFGDGTTWPQTMIDTAGYSFPVLY